MHEQLVTRFFCLADTTQNCTSPLSTVAKLMNAGLGKKQISFMECAYSAETHVQILSAFPALKEAGGYELMRVGEKQRNKLELIPVPLQGYTARYLKEVARQAKINIRPLQGNLALTPLPLDLLDAVSVQMLTCSPHEHTLFLAFGPDYVRNKWKDMHNDNATMNKL